MTEVTAGSGLFGPHLFDRYRSFQPAPAVGFACDVVRVPDTRTVTVLGGGWIGSGSHGADRLPRPVWPEGLHPLSVEGVGEVQTPLRGGAACRLRAGDRVWFRHAKSGEVMEHTAQVAVVEAQALPDMLPTYRGEGQCFL